MAGRQTAVILACVLTGAALVANGSIRAGIPEPSESVRLDLIPHRVQDWVASDLEVSERVLEALQSDSLLLREYRREGELPVWVYVDYHRRQSLGSQVHSPLNCYPGSGWTILDKEDDAVGAIGESRPVRWLRLRRGEHDLVALYWYQSRWGRSARETSLKAGMVRSALARRSSDAALFRFSTPVGPDGLPGAKERLLRFLEIGVPAVEGELPFGEGEGG